MPPLTSATRKSIKPPISQALVAGEPVGVGAQQRDQHGIVSGLPGREQHRDRGAHLVGQGVDLGGPPAA